MSISPPEVMTGESPFLKIPREIRDQIYELVLLEDTFFYPYSYGPSTADWSQSNRIPPQISILLVNKQMNNEGSVILYSQGAFAIASGNQFTKFFAMKEGATTHDYVEAHEIFPSRKLIGTLRLAFVPERLSESRHNSRVHHQWQKPAFREMSRRQRSKDFHQYGRKSTEVVWNQCLHVLEAMRGLTNLILDIEDAYCPTGCCRMLNEATLAFMWLTYKELDIRVEGQVIEGENAKVAHVLNALGFPDARASGTDRNVGAEGSNESVENIGNEQDHSTVEGVEDDSEDSDSRDGYM